MKNFKYLLSLVFILYGFSLYSMEAPPQAIANKFQRLLSLSRKQLDQEIKNNRDVLKEKDDKGKTLLIHAIEQRKYQHVKALLAPNKSKNLTKEEEREQRSSYCSAFNALLKTRDLELARIILKKADFKDDNPVLHWGDRDSIHDDPFQFFTYHFNKSEDPLFAALLLADYQTLDEIFIKNPERKSQVIPTKHAAHSTPLAWAKSLKDQKLIEYLEKKGAKDEYNVNQALLSDAARDGKTSSIKYWLQKGAAINAADKGGFTPLHWACIRGNAEMIAYLIQEGADVNMVDRDKGRTGLRWTLRMHDQSVDKGGKQMMTSQLLPCFFLLTAAGAQSSRKDIYGHNVSYWMLRQGFSDTADNIISSMIYRWRSSMCSDEDNNTDINSEKEKIKNYKLLINILRFQVNELKDRYQAKTYEELLDSDPVFVAIEKENVMKMKSYLKPYLPTNDQPQP